MNSISFRSRVEAGAKFLDAAYPEWRQKINLDKLTLSSCYRCVLGQIAGDGGFEIFCPTWKDDDHKWFADRGFYLYAEEFNSSQEDLWETLTAEWKRYLKPS